MFEVEKEFSKFDFNRKKDVEEDLHICFDKLEEDINNKDSTLAEHVFIMTYLLIGLIISFVFLCKIVG